MQLQRIGVHARSLGLSLATKVAAKCESTAIVVVLAKVPSKYDLYLIIAICECLNRYRAT